MAFKSPDDGCRRKCSRSSCARNSPLPVSLRQVTRAAVYGGCGVTNRFPAFPHVRPKEIRVGGIGAAERQGHRPQVVLDMIYADRQLRLMFGDELSTSCDCIQLCPLDVHLDVGGMTSLQ